MRLLTYSSIISELLFDSEKNNIFLENGAIADISHRLDKKIIFVEIMYNDRLKTLKIIAIVAVVIGILIALFYIVYSFALFWQAFAAGITISILLIIIFVLLILALYLWIKNFLLKREFKKQETELEQIKQELNRCRTQLRQKNAEESEKSE